MKILQKIDLFGTPILFRINENEKYHSLISVSLSLITLISTILFAYFWGLDFIFHLKSQVIQSTRTSKTYEFYNFSMNDFFFAWRIENIESEEINITNVLYPTIGYHSYKTGVIESIKYDRCKNYNISFSIPNNIKDYYCIDMKNYSQGGGWENENKVEFLYLKIKMCDKNQNCGNKSDFHNLLNKYGRVYLVVYFPTISYVPEEEIPYEISYNKKYIILDSKLVNINKFHIQKYIFEDDEGWVTQKIKTHKLFGVSDIETSNFINDVSDDNRNETPINSYLYSGNFYIDKKYSYYKRSFTKAFQSLAINYAFLKTIYIIFNFIAFFCNKFLMLETIMMNDNYLNPKLVKVKGTCKLSRVKNNSSNKIESSNINLKMLNNNISKENNNMIIKNLNQKKENRLSKEIIEIQKENINTKAIDFSNNNKKYFYSLLLYYIFHCLLPEKKKILHKISRMNRKTLQKKLDVYNYLHLLKRVDMLFMQIQEYKLKNKSSMIDFVC